LACIGIEESADRHPTTYAAEGIRVEDSKLIIDLNKNPKLRDIGGWDTFEAVEKKVIVLHPTEQEYKAFENKCTHKGGQFTYNHKDGFIQCALHGSRFDTAGQVIKGPATLPLPEFRTTLDKDQLTVYLA
jgi:Rieske Fe-S protein